MLWRAILFSFPLSSVFEASSSSKNEDKKEKRKIQPEKGRKDEEIMKKKGKGGQDNRGKSSSADGGGGSKPVQFCVKEAIFCFYDGKLDLNMGGGCPRPRAECRFSHDMAALEGTLPQTQKEVMAVFDASESA